MTIEEQINSGIKDAMKAHDKAKLDALRNVKKLILEAKTAPGASDTITDEKCIQIIQKLVKQGEDSATIYKEQNRADLYDAEMAQVEVLRVFLPKQLTEEELTEALKAIIAQVGATSMKDLGKVMGTATKQLAGKADGKAISAKVKELLQ